MEKNDTELYGERLISESDISCFPNPAMERDYEISIVFPEFTCQCPFSGYPDFAEIRLSYQPFQTILELKSLKLYINSYRSMKISHEEVANKILNDFVVASNPSWMQIEADFNPRGNVHTVVRVSHGSRKTV